MNTFDELLNKYLDNDITESELDELKNYLNDPINNIKFTEMKNLESILSDIKTPIISFNVSKNIMDNILKDKPVYHTNSKFILLINSFLIFLLFLAVLLIFMYMKPAHTDTIPQLTDIIKDASKLLIYFKDIITSKSIIIIGFILSLLLIVGYLFNYDSHKSFIKKINEI